MTTGERSTADHDAAQHNAGYVALPRAELPPVRQKSPALKLSPFHPESRPPQAARKSGGGTAAHSVARAASFRLGSRIDELLAADVEPALTVAALDAGGAFS